MRDPVQKRLYEQALARFVTNGMEVPELCGRPMSIGGLCPQPAGSRTDHEGFGACATHSGQRQKGRMEAAWLMAIKISTELDITPWEALLLTVRQEAGTLAFYQAKLNEVEDDEELKPGGDAYPWVDAAERSRVRLARFSKTAIDAGVAERLVRQTEAEGRIVAEALNRALDALELTSEQRIRAIQAAQEALLGQPKAIEGEIVG